MSTACLPVSPVSTRVKSRDGRLHAARYRNFHPTLGRWIERDPAGYLDGPNLSAYVSGNPATLTDPTGLCAETAPEPLGLWRGGGSIELLPYLPHMGEPRVELLPFIPLSPGSGILPLADSGFKKENQDFLDRIFLGPKSTPSGGDSNGTPAAPAGPSMWEQADEMLRSLWNIIDIWALTPTADYFRYWATSQKATLLTIIGILGSLFGHKVTSDAGQGVPKPSVTDPKLNNIVDDLYKGTETPSPIGSGSTADAIRNELKTGQPTYGIFHSQKGQQYVNGLQNWLKANPNASAADRAAAQAMLDDLKSALGGN